MDALPDSNNLLTDTVISPDDYGIPPSLLPPYIGGQRPILGPDYVKNDYVIAVTRRSCTDGYALIADTCDTCDPYDFRAHWADCYLVCEQALNRGFDQNHVILLYNVGVDFEEQGQRYRTDQLPYYENENNPNLTRYYGSYEALDSLMNWLSTGNSSEDIRAMTDKDFLLFFETYHGDVEGRRSFFNLNKNNNDTDHVAHVYDTTLARWADNIDSWRQVFIISSCHSGGFADQLNAPHRIIYTSSDINHKSQIMFEEDYYDSTYEKRLKFGHGDMTFPFFNAIRRKKIWPYDNPPAVDANLYFDPVQGISFEEAWKYQMNHNPDANWYSFPQHRDSDSIAHNTYFLAAPFLPPDRVQNLYLHLTSNYQFDTVFNSQGEIDTIYLNSLELFWNPDTTEDIYYYRVYKNGLFKGWTYGTHYVMDEAVRGDYFYVKAVDIYNDIGFPSDTVYFTSTTGGGGQAGTYVLKDIDIQLSSIINRKASIKLILPENKNIEIVLYNSTGRRIKTLYKGETAKGIHTLTLDTGKLSKGAYFVVLRTNNKNITRKIVVE